MFRGELSVDKDLLKDTVRKHLEDMSKSSKATVDVLDVLKREGLNKIIDGKIEDTFSTGRVEGEKMSLFPSNFEPVDINIALTSALNGFALNIAGSILSIIGGAILELALSKPYEETDEEKKKIYESERIKEAVKKRIEADKRGR